MKTIQSVATALYSKRLSHKTIFYQFL